MALNTKGIGTAAKQDSVQFFLGVASKPTKFNDYFLKTNKVANIRTTGDMQRTREQTEATCLDSERKLNVSGFEEATTLDSLWPLLPAHRKTSKPGTVNPLSWYTAMWPLTTITQSCLPRVALVPWDLQPSPVLSLVT